MGKLTKNDAGSSTSQGTNTHRVVAAAAAVTVAGSVVAYLYLRTRSASPYAGRVRGACLVVPPESDSRVATQLALEYVRAAYKKVPVSSAAGTPAAGSAAVAGPSLGALVHFLRGEPSLTFDGHKVTNAYRHRLPLTYIQYVEDNYLPSTKAAADSATKDPASSSSSSAVAVVLPPAVERGMFQELVELDFGFRCLEKYRATPFNNNDRTHVNLLQQLWVAAGNPSSSFQRTTPKWSSFGFQGEDPATDLRGAGILGLRQLVHFAQTYPDALQDMMAYNTRTQAANRDCWYLLAVVSLQMTAQLMLQKELPFFPAHLEILYDSLVPLSSNSGNLLRGASAVPGAAGTSAAGGGASTGAMPRRAAAQKLNLSNMADARVWLSVSQANATAASAKPVTGMWCGDAEAGMNALHHQLLLHFKACWERDEPHVMDYNTYTPKKVYETFFCAAWKPTEAPQRLSSQRGSSS